MGSLLMLNSVLDEKLDRVARLLMHVEISCYRNSQNVARMRNRSLDGSRQERTVFVVLSPMVIGVPVLRYRQSRRFFSTSRVCFALMYRPTAAPLKNESIFGDL